MIGNIAVPSYSPGIGKDVTIKMRIVGPPVLKVGPGRDSILAFPGGENPNSSPRNGDLGGMALALPET